MASAPPYIVNPSDPRAPSEELWNRLKPDERLRIVASLPSDFPSAHPPEGDPHRFPKSKALGSRLPRGETMTGHRPTAARSTAMLNQPKIPVTWIASASWTSARSARQA